MILQLFDKYIKLYISVFHLHDNQIIYFYLRSMDSTSLSCMSSNLPLSSGEKRCLPSNEAYDTKSGEFDYPAVKRLKFSGDQGVIYL